MRDVVTVLQRTEMVRRIAEEIERRHRRARRRRPAGPPPARGADGRRRGRPPPRDPGLLPRGRRLAPRRGARRARRPRAPRTCSTSRRSAPRCTCPAARSTSTRACSPAATGCWPRSPGCPSRHRAHRRPLRHPPEDHAGHDRRPRRRRGRRRDPGPGHQGGPVAAWPRPASSTATPDRTARLATMRIDARRPARPSSSPRPAEAAPTRGLVVDPRHLGLRPLFDDHVAAAGRRQRLGGVRVRAVAGARGPAARGPARARSPRSTTGRCWPTLVAAADRSRSSRSASSGSAWAGCSRSRPPAPAASTERSASTG